MTSLAYPTSFSITEVAIAKNKRSDKVGVTLKNNPREAGIGISGLTETSPFRGTAIRTTGGQVLIAVNGDPELPDAKAASTLISSSKKLSLLVCEQHQDYNQKDSCIQVVAAPFWRHNPGINFSSTRGRTLVTVSKIFKRGPFTDNRYVKVGDVVLAVNGIPVSKPEDADQALRMPQAEGCVTVLHTLDMTYFRAAAMNAVDATKIYEGTITFKPSTHDPSEHVMVIHRPAHSDKFVRIRFDPETQHMYDPEPYTKLLSENDKFDYQNPKVFFRNWYSLGAYKFMNLYNQVVDESLDPMEDAACEHAWRSSPSTALAAAAMAPISPSNSSDLQDAVEAFVPTPQSPDPYSLVKSKSEQEREFISC